MLGARSKEIRRKALDLSLANGGYHFGGSFSCAEILLALYDHVLTDEDTFILSKGHGCWVYYALLQERGFNPRIEGHPHRDVANGVHWTTGSLGHGMPAGVGMALAKKMQGRRSRTYVLVGDGELQEGTTWESMLLAAQHHLWDLWVLVDFNKYQGSGFTGHILNVAPIYEVAKALKWQVFMEDGHDIEALVDRLTMKFPFPMPHMIICGTVKGKGVSFMEGKAEWHAKFPNPEQLAQTRSELA